MDVLTNLADQNRTLTLVVNTAPGHGWSLAYLNARIMDWCDNEAIIPDLTDESGYISSPRQAGASGDER